MRLTRDTRQKKTVARTIAAMPALFTADELAKEVAADGIGIATVYRYLARRRRCGDLHKYRCGGVTLYSRQATVHAHFQCEGCGRTEHVPLKKADIIKRAMAGEVRHMRIDVTGICSLCVSRK